MGFSNWTHLEVELIVRETECAFLCRIDGQEHWIPRSVVDDADRYEEGDADVTISMAAWFAEKEGLA
jgi:hypothetical protein